MERAGRNDPCPCGSGKKYKKCCDGAPLARRMKLLKVDEKSESALRKTAGVATLFRSAFDKPDSDSSSEASSLRLKIKPKI